jgi:hypothetical protein
MNDDGQAEGIWVAEYHMFLKITICKVSGPKVNIRASLLNFRNFESYDIHTESRCKKGTFGKKMLYIQVR